ncbi:MAG: hypothetical protein WBN94_09415 [Methanothrix sp.]
MAIPPDLLSLAFLSPPAHAREAARAKGRPAAESGGTQWLRHAYRSGLRDAKETMRKNRIRESKECMGEPSGCI